VEYLPATHHGCYRYVIDETTFACLADLLCGGADCREDSLRHRPRCIYGRSAGRFSADLKEDLPKGIIRGFNPRIINGLYRIDGIPPGSYRLEVRYWLTSPGSPSPRWVWSTNKNLTLVEGQELTVDVARLAPGTITGRILDYGMGNSPSRTPKLAQSRRAGVMATA